MNDELIKELKDIGFPQENGVKQCTPCKKHQDTVDVDCIECNWVCIPTLSELIEVCGDKRTGFGADSNLKEFKLNENKEHLFRLGYGNDKEGWYADYEFYSSYLCDKDGVVFEGWGKTREEAVAKLYITLNKK